ncbi:GspH/FimT family pseudopilin [Chromobacterium sp. IIBBL 290-4]|uniref:GspH/FimT family pseudopilin n=1 Tax=Chromobacterium sp. IIBBL 290-4 TaxID=2953890 RepID=UPI0020B8B8B2|nr:GspH/FimT family pseudopilin [Chromobacterium sp. IIBBL 290-4]UTH76511.1 GspH/FimT family pseudopilin [Chromobacterium sp. IIBBL 290-4]
MKRGQAGLSLIELMMVIALAILFLSLALPAMGRWIARQQQQGALDDISHSLALARKTAVTRQKRVWVEFSRQTAGWLLRVSEARDGKGCDANLDLRCIGSEQHSGVEVALPDRALPYKLAFSPLRGMPQDEHGSLLNELRVQVSRPPCQPAELRLLATGVVSIGSSVCP